MTMEDWLKEYRSESTIRVYSKALPEFTEWLGKTAEQLITEYKQAVDKVEWKKQIGSTVVKYYNYLLEEKGLKPNSAKTKVDAVRAFFASQCDQIRVKKGTIAGTKIALGEHEFTLEELQLMYKIGDIRERAILTISISLGWSAEDFVGLSRKFLEPYLNEDLAPPIAFWYERGKTGAISRSHLTHESLDALRTWLKVTPQNERIFPITQDALNDMLKALVKRANIKPRGKIRFHLMRKFLMSALANSGINEWHVKLMIGKTVPADILTYLKDQTETLRNEFMNAHRRFTLSGFTNMNHSDLQDMKKKLTEMDNVMRLIAKYVAQEMSQKGAIPEPLKAFSEEEPKTEESEE